MLDSLRQHRFRAAWLPLLLVALFARALLPQGFMPTVYDGLPGLQICGPAALLLAGDDAPRGGGDHAREACPFAIAATPAPPPAPLASPVTSGAATAPAPLTDPVPPAAPSARAHPPRGPPTPA